MTCIVDIIIIRITMTPISILRIYKRFQIKPLPSGRFELNDDFEFGDITIPKGFITNGANIPRLFYIIRPPNHPDSLPAVAVHDLLCDTVKVQFNKEWNVEKALASFKASDNAFENRLVELGLGKLIVTFYMVGVRTYTYLIRKSELKYAIYKKVDLDVYKRNKILINKLNISAWFNKYL